MKSLIFAAQSLCKGSSSPHYLFLGPRFLLHKHRQTPHVSLPPSFSTIRFRDPPLLPNPMAACTDSTRPETSTFPHGPNQSRTTADEHRCISKFANLGRPRVLNHVSSVPICRNRGETINTPTSDERRDRDDDDVWLKMQEEARSDVSREPILSNYYHNAIFCHRSLERALANHLSIKLSDSSLPSGTLSELFYGLLDQDGDIVSGVKDDLRAVYERDPACISYVHCFLNYKGFLACQAHRVAHKLWTQDRKILALLIQNRVSEVFAVDIHPGAKIGSGILVDHATGLVVGETAVIGNDVSILHNVTLGGTGKDSGDRHPKIGDGVLIGAGTCILGNIRIGEGAKIGAGSVVLSDIPPRTTAVGNPARLVGGKKNPIKLDKMPSLTMDHTSHVSEWSDYVI